MKKLLFWLIVATVVSVATTAVAVTVTVVVTVVVAVAILAVVDCCYHVVAPVAAENHADFQLSEKMNSWER